MSGSSRRPTLPTQRSRRLSKTWQANSSIALARLRATPARLRWSMQTSRRPSAGVRMHATSQLFSSCRATRVTQMLRLRARSAPAVNVQPLAAQLKRTHYVAPDYPARSPSTTNSSGVVTLEFTVGPRERLATSGSRTPALRECSTNPQPCGSEALALRARHSERRARGDSGAHRDSLRAAQVRPQPARISRRSNE